MSEREQPHPEKTEVSGTFSGLSGSAFRKFYRVTVNLEQSAQNKIVAAAIGAAASQIVRELHADGNYGIVKIETVDVPYADFLPNSDSPTGVR